MLAVDGCIPWSILRRDGYFFPQEIDISITGVVKFAIRDDYGITVPCSIDCSLYRGMVVGDVQVPPKTGPKNARKRKRSQAERFIIHLPL